jgi:acylpyruvate hydrolase
MRLATGRLEGGTRALRIDGEVATVLPFDDVDALLRSGESWRRQAEGGDGESVGLGSVELLSPVRSPEKIICAGLNYRAHVLETGREIPAYPTLFAKFARCLIGPADDLVLPRASDKVDWEAELALVIGSTVSRIDEAEAEGAIAGYTVANDVSMRDWQRRTSEMLQGKAFERSTPVGPWLVSPDEVDPAAGLTLRCTVGDKVMQESTTSDMIFSPTALVSYVSQFITLVPGDLILTGTPAGVGGARKPPVFLAPGDVLRTYVEGIGELENACVEADA